MEDEDIAMRVCVRELQRAAVLALGHGAAGRRAGGGSGALQIVRQQQAQIVHLRQQHVHVAGALHPHAAAPGAGYTVPSMRGLR